MPLKPSARRLLKFLESRRGHWVSAVEMQALGIRNYRQRIHELRQAGYRIENRREYVGTRRDSCYRLLPFDGAQGIPSPSRGMEESNERNRETGRTGPRAGPAPGAGAASRAAA